MGDPKPSFTKTYKRADGEHIDDWGWVTDLEYFEDDSYPVELVEETWERTSVRRFWRLPSEVYSCEVDVEDDQCEEDAVGWLQSSDGVWLQVCAEHKGRGER